MRVRIPLFHRIPKHHWLGVSAATAALLATTAIPVRAALTPPISNSGVSSTGAGGDGGAGLGPAMPWLGSIGGINTATGNLFTEVPLTGWGAKGGMAVGFSLFHNSCTDGNDTTSHFAPKWSFSYNSYVQELPNGDLRFCEENGGVSTVVYNNGTYKTPPGMHITFPPITRTPGQPSVIVTNQDGTVLTYGPSGSIWYLTKITDRNGYSVAITRDSANPYQVTRVTETSTSRYITINWTNGKIAEIFAPNGQRWGFNYDGNGHVADVIWPDNTTQNPVSSYLHFDYDTLHNIKVLRDRRGNYTHYDYNDPSNYCAVTGVTDPSGNASTINYQASGEVDMTDPNQHTTKYFYANGQLQSVKDPTGNSIFYDEHDSNNLPQKITDRRNNVTRLTYDSNGNVRTITVPINGTQTATTHYDDYNQFGEPQHVTDALNHTTTYHYDTNGNLDSITDPLSHVTNFTVTGGLVTKITKIGDSRNYNTNIEYDANGYPSRVYDDNSVQTRAHYNVMGTMDISYDTTDHPTYYDLDSWERVIQIRKPGDANAPDWSVAFGLDQNGNTTSVRQPNQATAYYSYDANDRLTQAINGRGDQSQYGYDGPGQKGLLSWSQNGNGINTKRTYQYNERDLLIATFHPDGDNENWGYDQNGNITGYKNGDNFANGYTYDSRNLLTDIGHPSAYGVAADSYHFERDALGRVTSMDDKTGNTSMQYDAAGRLSYIYSPRGRVSYDYDAINRMWRKTLQGVGSWQNYFDNGNNVNRLYATSNPYNETPSYHYDAAGRVDYMFYGNGIQCNYNYDVQGRLRDMQYFKGVTPAAFATFHYDYDGAGRLVAKYVDGTYTGYGYDGANQLIQEIWRNQDGTNLRYNYQYHYDNNGNRTSKYSSGSQQESYSYSPGDRLQDTYGPYGHRHYNFNANGFLASTTLNGVQETSINSDMEERILSIVPANGTTTSFQYNGLGQRVYKSDYTGGYNYVSDGAGPGSPVLTDGRAVYTPGLSERRNGVSSFYQTGLLGNLHRITDANQNETDGETADAWGIVTGRYGSNPMPFDWGGAGGYQRDFTTGLVLMGNRYYDPGTGRFISRDPARNGSNWYAYANNNPVSNLDPLGLQSDGGGGSGGGTIGQALETIIGAVAILEHFGKQNHHHSKPKTELRHPVSYAESSWSIWQDHFNDPYWQAIPSLPDGLSLEQLGNAARTLGNYIDQEYGLDKYGAFNEKLHVMYQLFASGGPLDIRGYVAGKTNPAYLESMADTGNFFYGYFGKSLGLPSTVLLSAAGIGARGTNHGHFYTAFWGPSNGDQSPDQYFIRQGLWKHDSAH